MAANPCTMKFLKTWSTLFSVLLMCSSSVAVLPGKPLGLPLNDINVVVLTDTHSWANGHSEHEPYLNVDYGMVLSFYENLQKAVYSQGKEVFFLHNGDFMDGTGLGLQVERLFPILERMPFSALNLGNHELFFCDNLRAMRDKGFLDHWQGKYLTSNTVWSDTKVPIGHRFTYLTSKNLATPKNILTFGFLYDFEEGCADATVEKVEDVVKQQWFIDALTVNNAKARLQQKQQLKTATRNSNKSTSMAAPVSVKPMNGTLVEKIVEYKPYDAIIVLAHFDFEHPLIHVIRDAIRNITGNPNVPIQFIAGHTHVRGFSVVDDMSTSFEAGRYLDTIGFASFPWEKKQPQHDNINSNDTNAAAVASVNSLPTGTTGFNGSAFSHVFLDANRQVLEDVFGGNKTALDTGRGRALTHFLAGTRLSMGLTNEIGCSGGHYHLDLPMDHPRSLWGLYVREVIPHALGNNHSRVFIQRIIPSALRYDILVGTVTVDDAITVSPIRDEMVSILSVVEKEDLLMLLERLDVSAKNPLEKFSHLPKYAVSPWPNPIHHRHLHTFELFAMKRDALAIGTALQEMAADNSTSFSVWDIDSEPEVYKTTSGIQTSYGIWVSFIKDNWKCVTPEASVYSKFKEWLVWLVVVMALIGLVHYHSWINNHSSHTAYRSTNNYMRMAGVTVRNARDLQTKQYGSMDQPAHNVSQQPEGRPLLQGRPPYPTYHY